MRVDEALDRLDAAMAEVRREVGHMVLRGEFDEAPGAAALAPTGGSGGGVTDDASAHQPTPQVGDKWERCDGSRRGRLIRPNPECDMGWPDCWWIIDEGDGVETHARIVPGVRHRLVERDGKPWPPAQEQDPGQGGIPFAEIFTDQMAVMQDVVRVAHADGPAAAVERLIDSMVARDIEVPEAPAQEPEPLAQKIAAGEADVAAGRTITLDQLRERIDAAPEQEPAREAGVEPATDAEIAYYEEHPGPLSAERVGELIARVRQEQDRAESARMDADLMQDDRDRAGARAEKAEADATRYERMLGRAEAEVARMRPVVEAAEALRDEPLLTAWEGGCQRLLSAVLALRDAQEGGQ